MSRNHLDEERVNVADLTLADRPMRAVRQAVARAWRRGYRAQIARLSDLDNDRTQRLRELADATRPDLSLLRRHPTNLS